MLLLPPLDCPFLFRPDCNICISHRCGLFLNRFSKRSNFLDLTSKTGSEAVSAFGIGGMLDSWYVCDWGANSSFDVVGRGLYFVRSVRVAVWLICGIIKDSCHHVTNIHRVVLKVAVFVLQGWTFELRKCSQFRNQNLVRFD